jgi:beta-lactamase class A
MRQLPGQGRPAERARGRRMASAALLGLFVTALGAFIGSLAFLGAVLGQTRTATGQRLEPTIEFVLPSATALVVPSATQARESPTPTATRPASPTAEAVAPAPAAPDDPELRDAIEDALGRSPGEYAVVVRRLADGGGVSFNGDRVFYAASLYKLALLFEAERQRSEGLLDFDDTLTLTEEDRSEDLGTLHEVTLGEDGSISIRNAVDVMVRLSDNATAVAMLHHLGGASVDRTLASLGLQDTFVNDRTLPTTAADMALLMEAAVTGRGLDDGAAARMRALLLQQGNRLGIPAGVPDDVPVGNKTGTWEGFTHDVAFVDAPGGLYVIAILTEDGGGWGSIADVSAAVFEAMTR